MVPSNAELAAIWRSEVSLGCRWRPRSNQAGVLGSVVGGEAGGFYVSTERWPNRRAYMKPRKRDPNPLQARAAREKISADLAHEVGCNVPPVVLARRDDGPADEERACCVSLVLSPMQFSWEQVKPIVKQGPAGTELLRTTLGAAAARGFAFDTWVGQPDHNDHPHNIVFGYAPEADGTIANGDYIFLDYAMALGWGGHWEGERWRELGAAPFPEAMQAAIDTSVLGGILDRIESIGDDTIEGVVTRIPDDYLVPQQREVILRGLLGRKRMLRSLVSGAMIGGSP